jgi:basic membrane protein A and related proteins
MQRRRSIHMALPGLLALLTVVVIGCGRSTPSASSAPDDSPIAIKVAILLAPSGKGDKSYNDAALAGIERARSAHPLRTSEFLPARPEEYETFISRLIEQGSQLIIGVGFLYAEPFRSAAAQFPETRFLLLDAEVPGVSNLRSVTFRADQGSFLVGVAAARESRSRSVGFIGGMNIPIIQSFQCGFESGVQWAAAAAASPVKVHSVYLGSTPDAFSNQARGLELALGLISQHSVDILYHAAGASGNGVIEAASRTRSRAIGVDSDQSHLAVAGVVISSMRKRLDLAVANGIAEFAAGSFAGGSVSMDTRNGGVDLVLPGHLSPTTIEQVERAREQINAGALNVCSQKP